MKSSTKWILGLGGVAVIGAGGYFGTQAFVERQTGNALETLAAEIEALNDGSYLTWQDVDMEGRTVKAVGLDLFLARDNIALKSPEIRVRPESGSTYHIEMDDVVSQFSETSSLNAEFAQIDGLKIDVDEATGEQFVSFETSEWRNVMVSSQNTDSDDMISGNSKVETIAITQLSKDEINNITMTNVSISDSANAIIVNAPEAHFTNIELQQGDNFVKNVEEASVPNFSASYEGEVFLTGALKTNSSEDVINGNLEEPIFELNSQIDFAMEKFETLLLQSSDMSLSADQKEKFSAFLESLDVERLRGPSSTSLRSLGEGEMQLQTALELETLGKLDIEFLGIEGNVDDEEMLMKSGKVTYEDGILFDRISDSYIDMNPLMLSLGVQMGLNQILPKDPEIAKNLGKSVGNFLSGKNNLSISFEFIEPVSEVDLERLIENGTPLHEFVSIDSEGN